MKKYIVPVLVGIFAPLFVAYAVIQSLNNQVGQNQIFANDANVTVTSTSNVHSLGWSGVLPVGRGGTGASGFATGSVLFFGNGKVSENNSNFFWDNINNRLGIGTNNPTERMHVAGGRIIVGGNASTTISGDDQEFSFFKNGLQLGNDLLFSENIGVIFDYPTSTAVISSDDDAFRFRSHRIFEFENGPPLRPNTTVRIGEFLNGATGCLVIADSDGVGVTYLTTNDGMLFTTTTKPSICQ